MEMIPIVGIRNSPDGSGTPDNRLYDGASPNSILFFSLKEPTDSPEELHEYVDGIEELYFNCRVNTTPRYGYETIKGFIPTTGWNSFGNDYGFSESSRVDGKYTTGWIKMPVIEIGDHNNIVEGTTGANPIAKAAWQELRKCLPRVAYDKPEPTNFTNLDDLDVLIGELGSLGEEVNRAINGFNIWMRDSQRAQTIDLPHSYVRLNSPDKMKMGGGARVKVITISDEWGNMVPTVPEIENFSYGQEYTYTTEESFGDSTRIISSGVASYEPLLGGDENPFVLPSRYRIERPLALGLNLYMLEPFGESFFPSPNVGYSQVRIKNLSHEGVSRTATGFTQHEFYTARDFPTLVQQTRLQAVPSETPPNPFYSEIKATVSQGYSIELNDMHGKPKAEKIYQEINDEYPISGTEYIYKTETDNPHRLNNRALIFNERNGVVEEKTIGVDYDFIVDAREMKRETWGPGVQINTDGFMAAFVPIFIPIPYPDMSYSQSQYRGITTTKVIQRSGIIDKIVAYDLGSRITTNNMVYDGSTGNVLITKTQNEFEDDYYNTHIPAHWVYEGMGSAYKNIGLAFQDRLAQDGKFMIAQADLFVRGDELMVQRKDITEIVYADGIPIGEQLLPPKRAWVYRVNGTSITVIDHLGRHLDNGEYDLKVIRSGRRNMPFTALGKVITKVNPVASGQLNFTDVINAAAVEYQEHWQTYAGFLVPLPETTCSCGSTQSNQSPSLASTLSFINTLATSGDFKQDSLVLNTTYTANGYLNTVLGSGNKSYFGAIHGNSLQGVVRSDHEGMINDCTIQMQMTDRTIPFPDSITHVTLASPLFDAEDFTCGDVYSFNVMATCIDNHGNETINKMRFSSSCFRVLRCSESVSEFPPMTCDISGGTAVNPFLLGILGNWKPKANYTYVTERTQGRIDKQGVFSDFSSFWLPTRFSILPAADQSKWQWAQRNTITDPYGKVLEQKDPLNRYSSSIYGYGFNVPIAVATNARYHQIAFDGFEDYDYRNIVTSPFQQCPLPPHWKFETDEITIVDTESHTGGHSVLVDGHEEIISVVTPLCDPYSRTVPGGDVYPIQDCDLIRKFAPPSGNYLVQAWVREDADLSELVTHYSNASLEVAITVAGVSTSYAFMPHGQIIDEWQPIEGSFVVPENCEQIQVSLKSTRPAYFDDVRLQPLTATMETYVYDPITLKLVATLDNRNYATFYEYDKEGALSRTKKETERGILTLQEVRSANRKN